ncbi:MAG: hypothetical protein ACREVH_01565 [Gammaproteobacteria bacterium]
MSTAILDQARAADLTLWVEGETLRYRGDKTAVESLLPMLKAHKPELLAALNLETLLTEACQGVEGIDAATFRALLSPVDVEDIEGGHIPMVTLNAYARSFADGIRTGRIRVLAPAVPKQALVKP